MSNERIVQHKITRRGGTSETVASDEFRMEGDPPEYLFLQDGKTVFKIFVSELEGRAGLALCGSEPSFRGTS